MKFGYYLLNTYVPELDGDSRELYSRWLEQIDAAEDMRFDSLWVTEHHFRLFGGMMPSPQMLLSAGFPAHPAAPARLGGVAGAHAPRRSRSPRTTPCWTSFAKGRLLFGAGRGMSPHEYEVYGLRLAHGPAPAGGSPGRHPHGLDRGDRGVRRGVFQLPRHRPCGRRLAPAAASAHLRAGQPGPRQLPHDRPQRLPPDDAAVDRQQRGAAAGASRSTWKALREAGYSEDGDHDVFVMYPIYVGEDDGRARAEVEEAWHRWREFALDEVRLDPARAPMVDKIFERLSYDNMVQGQPRRVRRSRHLHRAPQGHHRRGGSHPHRPLLPLRRPQAGQGAGLHGTLQPPRGRRRSRSSSALNGHPGTQPREGSPYFQGYAAGTKVWSVMGGRT